MITYLSAIWDGVEYNVKHGFARPANIPCDRYEIHFASNGILKMAFLYCLAAAAAAVVAVSNGERDSQSYYHI